MLRLEGSLHRFLIYLLWEIWENLRFKLLWSLIVGTLSTCCRYSSYSLLQWYLCWGLGQFRPSICSCQIFLHLDISRIFDRRQTHIMFMIPWILEQLQFPFLPCFWLLAQFYDLWLNVRLFELYVFLPLFLIFELLATVLGLFNDLFDGFISVIESLIEPFPSL